MLKKQGVGLFGEVKQKGICRLNDGWMLKKGEVLLDLGRMKRGEQKHTTDSNNAVFSSSHMRHLKKKKTLVRMLNGFSFLVLDLKWCFVKVKNFVRSERNGYGKCGMVREMNVWL
ncbi:unnamed protein product [Vicia faba]|uniref:Uncharacterized protein n=1 Tax=Vicia faba TaxID=3906 RepID=A0AAV0YPU7_VICFA|nr:unnamed protein product [Vicia faba]